MAPISQHPFYTSTVTVFAWFSLLFSNISNKISVHFRLRLGVMAVALVDANHIIDFNGADNFLVDKLEWKMNKYVGPEFFVTRFADLYADQNPQLDAVMEPKIDALLGEKLRSLLDTEIGSKVAAKLEKYLSVQKNSFMNIYMDRKIDEYFNAKVDAYVNEKVHPLLNANITTDLAAKFDAMISRETKYLVLQIDSETSTIHHLILQRDAYKWIIPGTLIVNQQVLLERYLI